MVKIVLYLIRKRRKDFWKNITVYLEYGAINLILVSGDDYTCMSTRTYVYTQILCKRKNNNKLKRKTKLL